MAEAGVEPSVGSRRDSDDNALAETINGLYKAELIHRRAPWKTREALELATLEWVASSTTNVCIRPSATSRLPSSRQTTTINSTALNNRLFYSNQMKNWSLIYPDQRRAKLAPAYDFVSTIALYL